MEKPTAQAEHLWLQKLVGSWTWVNQWQESPESPVVKFEGVEVVSPIGEVWIQGVSTMKGPSGGESISQLTLGYDPAKGRFVGTFLTSMMTYLWVYDGFLDEGDTKLVLQASGPSMDPTAGTTAYRDVIEFHGPNRRTFSSFMQKGSDWVKIMETTYLRTSAG